MTAPEDRAISNATEDPEESKIKLQVHVWSGRVHVYLERPAPKLPPGVCWQAGVWFWSGYCDSIPVQEVEVFPDGSVVVKFEVEWESGFSADLMAGDLIHDGWELSESFE